MSGKSQWLPSKGDARVIKAVAPLHPAPPPPFYVQSVAEFSGPAGASGAALRQPLTLCSLPVPTLHGAPPPPSPTNDASS